MVLGLARTVFWLLVLCGVFVLGLGYGRTVSGDDNATKRRVTVDQDLGTVEATLPTRTITTTKTVTVRAPAVRTKPSAR